MKNCTGLGEVTRMPPWPTREYEVWEEDSQIWSWNGGETPHRT